MVQERLPLDREKTLAQDRARQSMRVLVQQICQLVAEKERLGTPYREGREIIIPILRAITPADEDGTALHALVAAWLDVSDSLIE